MINEEFKVVILQYKKIPLNNFVLYGTTLIPPRTQSMSIYKLYTYSIHVIKYCNVYLYNIMGRHLD